MVLPVLEYVTRPILAGPTISPPLYSMYIIRVLWDIKESAERWPSAAARDQHFELKGRGYLRSMLSRRQLQGFVMLGVPWKLSRQRIVLSHQSGCATRSLSAVYKSCRSIHEWKWFSDTHHHQATLNRKFRVRHRHSSRIFRWCLR